MPNFVASDLLSSLSITPTMDWKLLCTSPIEVSMSLSALLRSNMCRYVCRSLLAAPTLERPPCRFQNAKSGTYSGVMDMVMGALTRVCLQLEHIYGKTCMVT